MAAYKCDLEKDQQIHIENQGTQTTITLTSGGPDQQQSQGNSFDTGNWRVPPTVFRTSSSVVLRIEAEQGEYFIQVQANGMSRLNTSPALSDADVLPLQKVEAEDTIRQSSMPNMEPMQPMKSMQPMEPMRPMEPMKPMEQVHSTSL